MSAGLTPRLRDDGSIEVRQVDRTVVFVIPAGNMSDSTAPDPAFSEDVDYTLENAGPSWKLTVVPDMGWLSDPAREYPVRIDPTVLTKSIQRNCWLDQTNTSSNGCGINASYLRVGGGSGALRRTAIDFDTTTIPSTAIIDSADLRLYLYSAQGTSNTTVNYGLHRPGKSWNNGATWSMTGISSDTWSGGTPSAQVSGTSLGIYAPTNGWRTFNATSFVTNWKNGTWPRDGIVIRQENESTPSTHIAFASGNHPTTSNRPQLVVTYRENTPPTAPYELVASDGAAGYTVVSNPLLSARTSDPDTGPLYLKFELYRANSGFDLLDRQVETDSAGYASVFPDDLQLVRGVSYTLKATAFDGSVWSSTTKYPFVYQPGLATAVADCAQPCTPVTPTKITPPNGLVLAAGETFKLYPSTAVSGAIDLEGVVVDAHVTGWATGTSGGVQIYDPNWGEPEQGTPIGFAPTNSASTGVHGKFQVDVDIDSQYFMVKNVSTGPVQFDLEVSGYVDRSSPDEDELANVEDETEDTGSEVDADAFESEIAPAAASTEEMQTYGLPSDTNDDVLAGEQGSCRALDNGNQFCLRALDDAVYDQRVSNIHDANHATSCSVHAGWARGRLVTCP